MHWGCFGCVCRCRSSTRLALPWWWEWASLLFAPPHTNAVFYGHHPPGQGQGKTGSGVGNAQLSAVGIACSVGGRDTLMLGLGTATYSYTPCNTASFPVDFLQSTFPAQCVVEQGELANAKVLFIAHVHTQARGHTSTPHPHPHQTSAEVMFIQEVNKQGCHTSWATR